MKIEKILVVDDSEADHLIYKITIQKHDPSIEVLSAYDGQEALEVLENEMPQCILLDINMPRMNGFQFLEEYSKKYSDQHVIIAMITSSHNEDDRKRAMAFDVVQNYFNKPLTKEDFKEIVEIAIKKFQ